MNTGAERKVCEVEEVSRLAEICPHWPVCRAELKTELHLEDRRPPAQVALGFFCACKPKR